MVQELCRHSALDEAPIVMLTARADGELRMKLLRHGVQDCIQTHLQHHVGGSYSFPASCSFENGLVTRFSPRLAALKARSA